MRSIFSYLFFVLLKFAIGISNYATDFSVAYHRHTLRLQEGKLITYNTNFYHANDVYLIGLSFQNFLMMAICVPFPFLESAAFLLISSTNNHHRQFLSTRSSNSPCKLYILFSFSIQA